MSKKEELAQLEREKKVYKAFEERFYKMFGKYPYYKCTDEIENKITKLRNSRK